MANAAIMVYAFPNSAKNHGPSHAQYRKSDLYVGQRLETSWQHQLQNRSVQAREPRAACRQVAASGMAWAQGCDNAASKIVGTEKTITQEGLS